MGVFNYSRFHYFDKDGHELILSHKPGVRINIINDNIPEFYAEYALVKSTPDEVDPATNSSLLQIKSGMRFNIEEGTTLRVHTSVADTSANEQYIGDAFLRKGTYELKDYTSTFGNENYPYPLYNDTNDEIRRLTLDRNNLALDTSVNFFPSYTFNARIEFNKVSTGLVETQTIYVLVDDEYAVDKNGSGKFVSVAEYAKHYDDFANACAVYDSSITQLREKINSIDSSIKSIHESDSYHLGLINDLENLKESTEKEINDLLSEAEDLYSKRDYFQSVKDYIERFKLLFFIDCREQKDFRLFDVKYDEMTWTDRKFLDFKNKTTDGCNNNGFSANIGFSGENDGVYEHTLYICLVDESNTENSELGEVYPIGEVLMSGETEGEDERYRTFFENFGIPDPKYYNDIFLDSDISNDSPDYISINKNSKKMFLAYNDIFPYIGSYKGLLNAIKTLGYEDEIFFKEWYKEIGNSALDDSGYTTYEISFKDTSNRNVISNLDLSERIHLRKMNWVSMIYKINEELDKPEDKWGFPSVITNYKNFNTDRLAKILSLKNWLEKYAIGVNCHITDVGGEGLVFERYNLQKYGTYQKVFEYDNEKAISAVVQQEYVTLTNGSANIKVDIHTTDKDVMIEEIKDLKFLDFCDGFFDENNNYHDFDSDVIDSSCYVYFGKCFDLHDNINTFEVRTRGKHSSYKFGTSFLDTDSPHLIVDDDRIMFDYYQCFRKYKNSAFLNPPIIQIETGVIKKFSQKYENIGSKEYYANIYPYIENGTKYYRIEIKQNRWGQSGKIYDILEVPTFIPPTQKFNFRSFIEIQEYVDNPEWKYVITDHDGRILYGVHTDDTEYAPDLSEYTISDDQGKTVRVDILINDIKRNSYAGESDDNDNDFIQLDPLSYISKISNNTRIERHKNHKYGTDSDYYQRNGNTYGLRYCTDNTNNIPCFKILGYEEKHLLFSNDHIRFPHTNSLDGIEENPGFEYMLEIINGRMIFNDPENNSVITLNFIYDDNEKHQYIYVNTFKESGMSSMYKYKISDDETTNRFLPSHEYNYFIDGYKSNVDEYVEYDGTKAINVNHTGEYTIDAILYDEFNNIFAKRSSNKVNVLPQFADSSVFGPEKNSGSPYNQSGELASTAMLSNLLSIFNNRTYGVSECVFEHAPKLQISNVNNNHIEYYGKQVTYDSTPDTGTNILENEKLVSKVIISSMSDRYDIIAEYTKQHDIQSKIFRLVKTSGYYGHIGIYDKESFDNVLSAYDITKSTIEKDLDQLYNKSLSEKNGSFADVMLYVYDEVCEYPLFSVPGVMLPGTPYISNPDGYDDYYFMPIPSSKTDASTLSYKLSSYCSEIDAPRLTYYVIPQWAIPCKVDRISQENNIIDITLSHQIFSNTLYNRYNLKNGKMMTLFYNTNNSNYFGKGSYMIKNRQSGTKYTLYAYLGKKRKGEAEQSGFDGSTWFGPPSLDYMIYDCDINEKLSDNQSNSLYIINNINYKYAQKFIDQNYAVSLRNFDPNDAIEIWEYNSDDYTSYLDVKGKYIHTTPITTTIPYVEILPHIPGYINNISNMISNNMTVRWKIYKKYGSTSRKLIMECFNKVLFLKFKEYGTYDIEMTLWDSYGNKFEKKMDGYITYKKSNTSENNIEEQINYNEFHSIKSYFESIQFIL